jgi:hypothetical protein
MSGYKGDDTKPLSRAEAHRGGPKQCRFMLSDYDPIFLHVNGSWTQTESDFFTRDWLLVDWVQLSAPDWLMGVPSVTAWPTFFH